MNKIPEQVCKFDEFEIVDEMVRIYRKCYESSAAQNVYSEKALLHD